MSRAPTHAAPPSAPCRSGAWRPSPLVGASLVLHAVVLVVLVARPSLWPWLLGLSVADHLVLLGASLWPRSRLLGPNTTRLPSLIAPALRAPGAGARGAVALTFDDGPDPEVTPFVLDELDVHGHRATFFLIGDEAERHPDLVREIAARGHDIANHTYRHSPWFAFYGPFRLAREIDRAQAALVDAGAPPPAHFRAPAGIRNPLLDPILHRRGLELVSWTRRGYDAVKTDVDEIHRLLVDDLAPGDILLLHDGRRGRQRHRPSLLPELLPRVLSTLEASGLRSVPLGVPAGPPHDDREDARSA